MPANPPRFKAVYDEDEGWTVMRDGFYICTAHEGGLSAQASQEETARHIAKALNFLAHHATVRSTERVGGE
jgi:hypothetical protein